MQGTSIARLVVLFTVTQIGALTLGLYVMYSFTRQTIIDDARTAVEVARDSIRDDFRDGGPIRASRNIAQDIGTPENKDLVVLLRDPRGTRVVGNLTTWPSTVGDQERWRTINLYREGARVSEEMGLVTTRLGGGYSLLTGQILEKELALTRASEKAMLLGLVLSVVVTSLIAFLLSRFLENQIDRFSGVADAVETGHFSARVERNRSGDAFDRLGSSINSMLARIERLVRELRMVTDSMAHDLRSPVSRMKVVLERGLGRTKDIGALTALGEAIEEADGLHRMLDTALQISRAEAGIGRDQFTRFDMHEVLTNLAEIYGPVAEEFGFELSVDCAGSLPMTGHRDLLTQAISNLVDNALKYARAGRRIELHGSISGRNMEIAVRDDGPGIPADKVAEAMTRFGRLDTARTESGSGLGLSLVETIAHLHEGTMHLSANGAKRLAVTLQLPIGEPADVDHSMNQPWLTMRD